MLGGVLAALLPGDDGLLPVLHLVFSNHPSLRGIESHKLLGIDAVLALSAVSCDLLNRWRYKTFSPLRVYKNIINSIIISIIM